MAESTDKAFSGSDRFELQRRLGKGAFGVVYQAYDRQRDAVVALKTLREVDAEALFRFKREFRALAELIHPNLVRLYELLSDGERWFFTMELIEGVGLLDYVRAVVSQPALDEDSSDAATTTEPLSAFDGAEQRLRAALPQLVDGISVLHEVGIVHRDLKPANVLVTAQGRVVVLDFGLMGELAPGSYKEETTVGRFVGTPTYMAPEQIDQRPKAEACDWYSVGVMLFEALTGRAPFTGTVLKQLVYKQQTDAPHPAKLVADLPEDLTELCASLLRRRPEERPTGEQIRSRFGGSATLEYDVELPPESVRLSISPQTTAWIATAQRALASAAQRRPAVLYIHGESASRRRKVSEALLLALQQRTDDVVVLRGRCNQRETVPYQAVDSLVDMLCSYLRALPLARAETLVPTHSHALTQLFPVLRRVHAINEAQLAGPASPASPASPAAPNDAQLRKLGWGALRQLLAALGRQHKLVLFIDDLHWGDRASATALLELLSGDEPPPLLLCASYQRDQLQRSELLQSLLPALPVGASPTVDVYEIAL